MITDMQVWGEGCQLVATALVLLADDSTVEVPLTATNDKASGELVLAMDFTKVQERVLQRLAARQ